MKPTIVIITGLAGAGKTLALRALEDAEFYCVDNLPVTLMEPFISIITANPQYTNIGMGIDIREKEFLPAIEPVLLSLRRKCNIEIIFLEAERNALIRRFKETRRPHPLVSAEVSIENAADIERDLLMPLRREADRIIDTSNYTPHQLRHLISSLFSAHSKNAAMAITLISFGHKYGIPQSLDLLFDVRFISNPFFVPALRELKGTDAAIRDFVLEKQATLEFIDKASDLLNFLIPHYIAEGKPYLTVGFGCTGGRHRSPVIAEKIAAHIKDNPIEISIVHRDIDI